MTFDESRLSKEELEEYNEAERTLTPPPYVPTELEIERARSKLWVEETLAMMTWDYKKGDLKSGNRLADKYFWDLPDEIELPWDHPDHMKRFEYYKDGLTSMHWGSCTATACSCDRCAAEDLFNVPYTCSAAKSSMSHTLHTWLRLKYKGEGQEVEYYRVWRPDLICMLDSANLDLKQSNELYRMPR